jgi:hypothetical protein
MLDSVLGTKEEILIIDEICCELNISFESPNIVKWMREGIIVAGEHKYIINPKTSIDQLRKLLWLLRVEMYVAVKLKTGTRSFFSTQNRYEDRIKRMESRIKRMEKP